AGVYGYTNEFFNTIGHQPTLRILLQCGRSTGAFLHTGHSIGATRFSRLDDGCPAFAGMHAAKGEES
ncbi:MAG: hypothetical protein Q8R95_07200, partial [Azonexus sp.]|nr:hypothetical protein [Azonexus sp.]